MLELENDLGAEWLLDLWKTVPALAKAARIREATIVRLLKGHRIRRFDAVMCSISCANRPLRWPPVRPKPPLPTSLRLSRVSAS